MAPQAGLTPAQRAAKKFRVGSEEFQKGQLIRIIAGLKKREDIFGQVDNFLCGLSVLEQVKEDDPTYQYQERAD